MTPEQAIAAMRARWAHAPLDVRDVEERIACRLDGEPSTVRRLAFAARPAVRVFVSRTGEPGSWRSAYVHTTAEVDGVVARLERLAA